MLGFPQVEDTDVNSWGHVFVNEYPGEVYVCVRKHGLALGDTCVKGESLGVEPAALAQ